MYRTPDLCAMHQDDSEDLSEIGKILNATIGVSAISKLELDPFVYHITIAYKPSMV